MKSRLNIDELCRLRSDLKTGWHVGSVLRTQKQMNNYIKALDEVIENAPTVEEISQLSEEQIVKITDLLEREWGYEGIKEDVSRILRGGET